MAEPVKSLGETYQPFVPATETRRELSLRAAILGSVLGVIFGASSVYLALKVGITVSASIPIAVLSIPIFRALGKGSILENNLTQTVGSAGESIAAGVVFTVPALLVMGYQLDLARATLIALTGGWLGVMLMIPLRRSLIVKEHGVLTYPEGTACAEVLEAGEKKGVQARFVFMGLGVGLVYKVLYKVLGLWKEIPEHVLRWYKGAGVEMEASPELLGVGYIIGPRVAGSMVGGGVLSYLVLMPIIRFFGEKLTAPVAPAVKTIASMSNNELRSSYIYYIGAGAVASAGIISLIRTMPTIVRTFRAAMVGLRGSGKGAGDVKRTERDLPVSVTIGGVVLIALLIAILPQLHVNFVAAILIVVFGFFFSTVSSRICGQIGSSSNPISGMTIATILLTCVLFVAAKWTGAGYRPIALTVGAIVCVAAANAGATSQDLKTGFLVGSTPRSQQIGILIGVTTSALLIGWTLYFINRAYTTTVDERILHPGLYAAIPPTENAPSVTGPDGKTYHRMHTDGDRDKGIPPGDVFVDTDGTVAFAISPGLAVPGASDDKVDAQGRPVQAVDDDGKPQVDDHGAPVWAKTTKFEAPKANLMAILIDSLLQNRLPWALVLFGVFITFVLELAGIEALPFAVGLYLPLSSSTPIFVGGVVRWVADKTRKKAEGETGPGVLFSSGLIAGGSLCGLIAAAVAVKLGEDGLYLVKHPAGDLVTTALFIGLAVALGYVATSRDASAEPRA